MATKKSAIVKAVDGNDLAKAGVDVKLTKMEIADYIAAKAKEELENRQNTLNDLIRDYMQNGVVVKMNKQQKIAADALKVVLGKDVFVMALYHTNRWTGWLTFKNDEGNFYACSHFVQVNLDPDQIPDIDVNALIIEQRDCWQRIQNLGKKSHRTILVEQILSGSESGKKVLADLQGMVTRAING